jgi:hypothetical protein
MKFALILFTVLGTAGVAVTLTLLVKKAITAFLTRRERNYVKNTPTNVLQQELESRDSRNLYR